VPGIISAILCAMLLRDPVRRAVQGFDGVGLALMAMGLGGLQYVLDEGERYDWFNDQNILLTALLAVASLVTFVYWELRVVKNPIVDVGILLRKRTVAAGCALAMLLAFSLFGGVILAPQFQQLLLNFTATLSGLSILTRALGIMVMTFVTLGIMNRFKVRPQILLAIGFVIVAIANFQTTAVLTTNSVFGTFVWPLVFGGIGFGMLFVPLTVSVLSSVQGPETQKATSLLSLFQQLGGSVSTAILVTLLDRRGAFHQDHLAASVNLSEPAFQHALAAHAPLTSVAAQVSEQATTLAFGDAFFFLGVITLVFTPLVLFLRPPKGAGQGAPVAHAIAAE
jgi:MFS transporter, DHA2 family, multidrug resistance protein